jgi:hypothetical protein
MNRCTADRLLLSPMRRDLCVGRDPSGWPDPRAAEHTRRRAAA